MKIFFTLLILSISFSKVVFAQFEEKERTFFYENEWQNFKLLSQSKILLNPDTTIDIKFYHLDINVAIDSHYIAGSVYIQFQPTVNNINSIRLNLHSSMIVDSVSMDAVSSFPGINNILVNLLGNFNIGDLVEIKIYYHGVPILANGIKGLRYSTHGYNEPIIASLSTPFLSHYWWPCKDGPEDKADSVYVDITIKDSIINGIPLIAVSNGLLDQVDSSSGIWKTFKWKHRYPIVPYYIMTAISNYRIINQTYYGTNSIFPLTYYVFDQNYTQSIFGVTQIPAALDCFIELYGEYPFKNEKYGMTELGFYGAIENQTNTIINNMNAVDYLISVHELSHQWFGDMITCKNWHHAWMNEGFASYSEALYVEYFYGYETYLGYMNSFEFYGAGTLYLPQDTDAFNIFQHIVYRKGAYVLHMLRGVLGDSVFFDCLHTYATSDQCKYGHVITEDFKQICETISGQNLQYFFDQWIYDQYYPQYKYNFYSQPSNQTTALTICQKQVINGWRTVFKMPLQIKFQFSSGTDTLITVMNEQENQTYYFNFIDSVINVIIDPNKWVLKSESFDPSINVSLNEYIDNSGFIIYPNPASDIISVIINANLLGSIYTISDLSGRIVLTGKLTSECSKLNINELSIGMYIFKIGKQNKQTFKVMKK